MGVDPLQAEAPQIALVAAADRGFALAGGNALVAHGLVRRPIYVIDLFRPEPDLTGIITVFSEGAERMLGYAAPERGPEGVADVFPDA